MEKKKIKIDNYALVIVQLLIIGFGCYLVVRNYQINKENDLNTPYITTYLNEVKYEEFDNYVSENLDTVLYICISNNQACRDFEKKFAKTITKYNLKNSIVYLNTEDYANFFDTYKSNELNETGKNLGSVPAIFIFQDGKIYDMANNNNGDLDTDDVIQLLEKYEVIQ